MSPLYCGGGGGGVRGRLVGRLVEQQRGCTHICVPPFVPPVRPSIESESVSTFVRTYPLVRPLHQYLAQAELPGEGALRPREEAHDGAAIGAAGDDLVVRRGQAEVRERALEEGDQAHVLGPGEAAGACVLGDGVGRCW